MPKRAVTDARRHEIESEVCSANEYFLYHCIDKEKQKARVAASRNKSASSKTSGAPGVPLSKVKKDLEGLQKIQKSTKGDGSRKLPEAEAEATAQKTSDKIAKSIAQLKQSSKPVSKQIEEGLKSSGLQGDVRKRARSLAASKGARVIKDIFE